MSDSWEQRRKAKEEEFFLRQNKDALARLKGRQQSSKPRLSPITGEPMQQETLMGVVIDRCPTTKGIWLDAGELEQLLERVKSSEEGGSWLKSFIQVLSGK